MCAYLQDNGSARQIARAIAESRIEEPGVMGPKLSARGFVGHHLGGIIGRNADPFFRAEDIKFLGLEEQRRVPGAPDRLPKDGRSVMSQPGHLQELADLLPPEPQDPPL